MSQKSKELQQQVPLDPRVLQAMYGTAYEEDEIDLLAYWQVIWKKRKLILGVPLIAAILAVGLSLMKPNIYRAEVLLAPVGGEQSKGGLSSVLGGLGGLASMAGLSVGGGTVEQNIAVLKSREFIWHFVKDEKLMPILFEDAWDAEKEAWLSDDVDEQPSVWDVWRLLIKSGVVSASIDKDSGLVTLAIEWKDPELATVWVMKLVQRLNAHLREHAIAQSTNKLLYLEQELARTHVEENRKVLFDLISTEQKQAMLANTQQEYAFRVIDPAYVPDKKIKPKRAIIVLATAFVVGFLCVVFVFIQEGMRKRKEDESLIDAEQKG